MSTPTTHTTRHRSMMLALLTQKACVVAEQFDITESRLSVLRNSPLWKEEERLMVEEIQLETKLKLIGANLESVDTLIEVRDSVVESGATRISAAKELLSRGGFPTGLVITTSTEDTTYEGVNDSIKAIQEAKTAMLLEAGMTEEELFAEVENGD